MTQIRKWSLLAGVAVLAIVAVGWMAVLKPVRDDVATINEQSIAQHMNNDQQRVQIASLKRQAVEIAAQTGRVKELEGRIPDKAELPNVLRQISAAANTSGIVVNGITPQQPNSLEGTAGADATASLYVVPVLIDVSGKYASLEKLLRTLEDLHRAFLVTGVNVLPGEQATGGGVLTMKINGQVFTRTAASGDTSATPKSGSTAAALPTANPTTGDLG